MCTNMISNISSLLELDEVLAVADDDFASFAKFGIIFLETVVEHCEYLVVVEVEVDVFVLPILFPFPRRSCYTSVIAKCLAHTFGKGRDFEVLRTTTHNHILCLKDVLGDLFGTNVDGHMGVMVLAWSILV